MAATAVSWKDEERSADMLASQLEKRLMDLREGYNHLNALAMAAPSGLANAAAASQARLSAFGTAMEHPAVGAWNSERHRDVLYEAREEKRNVDLKYRATREGRSSSSLRQGASALTPARKKEPEENMDYPVAIGRYRGGFHGEAKPKGEKKVVDAAATPPPSLKTKKKTRAPVPKPTIIVKDDTNAKAAVAFAKKILRETADAAKRAADAADRAADHAAEVAARPAAPAIVVPPAADDMSDYRVLPVKKKQQFQAQFVETRNEGDRPVHRPTRNDADAPYVTRIAENVLLAKPLDAGSMPLPRPRKNRGASCVEPGLSHAESERLLALAEATPLYFPSGAGGQRKRRGPFPNSRTNYSEE